jgi:IS1 family transposase
MKMNFINFNFVKLNELNFGEFINKERDAENFILQNNLVNLVPPPCSACESEMRVEKNRGKPIFRCRKYNCRKSLSPLTGTWLERVRLTKLQVLKLVFLFCCHRPVTQAMEIAGVASEAAVNWYKFCRQVCQIVNQNLPFVPIGGPGLTVEVDETALWRRKYNKGRVLRKQTQWIFAGICRETKRVFVVPVRVRGARTLISLIQKYVGVPLVGQQRVTIYSDGWPAYSGLGALGYDHGVVIHKRNYLNPQNHNVHTQTVERLNRTLKEFLPATSNADLLDSHIHQFLYFRRLDGLTVGEVFKNFISDIVKVHPGGGKIGLRPFVNSYKTPHLYEGYIS